jgi:hypothetical protein
MNNFDFKNYLAAGGVGQQLIETQVHEEINFLFEEFLSNSINENIIEDKTQLEESAIGLIAGGLLSAPKLLALLGKLVKKIAKLFGKDTSEEGVAAKIEKAGENLEEKYIKLLMKAIKLTGLAKKVWTKEDGSIDQDVLQDTAEVVFAVILAVAAISATGGAISAFKEGSALFGALETGLTGIKSAEISGILGKVGSKLAA